MKTILTAAAIAVAAAGTASAMTSPEQLINSVQSRIDTVVSGVDVHALSDAQIAALHLALSSEDGGEKRSSVKAILN